MKKRYLKQTTSFSKELKRFISKGILLQGDFDEFKKDPIENSDQGDLIPATNGVRKTRLKSASGGKRGGFRICYLDLPHLNLVYMLFIYPKNEREDLSPAEKKNLKK